MIWILVTGLGITRLDSQLLSSPAWWQPRRMPLPSPWPWSGPPAPACSRRSRPHHQDVHGDVDVVYSTFHMLKRVWRSALGAVFHSIWRSSPGYPILPQSRTGAEWKSWGRCTGVSPNSYCVVCHWMFWGQNSLHKSGRGICPLGYRQAYKLSSVKNSSG